MLSLTRIAGASFPFAASMVQLQSELSARDVQQRLRRIEDPISHVHPDVRELSEQIYAALRARGSFPVEMSEEFYAKYARPLAMLKAALYLGATHAMGNRRAGGIWANNPSYVLYMCALFEDHAKMQALVDRVDKAVPGTSIDGYRLGEELGLPPAVVKAVCETYSDMGLGLISHELRSVLYIARS